MAENVLFEILWSFEDSFGLKIQHAALIGHLRNLSVIVVGLSVKLEIKGICLWVKSVESLPERCWCIWGHPLTAVSQIINHVNNTTEDNKESGFIVCAAAGLQVTSVCTGDRRLLLVLTEDTLPASPPSLVRSDIFESREGTDEQRLIRLGSGQNFQTV